MRTTAFVIMMLLATSLSTAMSGAGAPRFGASLLTSDVGATTISHGSKGLKAGEGEMKTKDSGNEWAMMKCLSAEFCNEKKVICSRICKHNAGVETQHFPEKCIFKCKKCIPTC